MEFTVSGQRYRCGKLSAVAQFHVVRRLAPLAAVLGKALQGQVPGQPIKALPREKVLLLAGEAVAVLGTMPDADVDYILAACLGVVERWEVGTATWCWVWQGQAKRMMYADVTMPGMVMICGHVLRYNLGPFTLGSGAP